jgi:preprotein translocase subunit SecY
VIEKLRSIFKIPELRKRVLFTLALLVVYRVGGHVPVPGINGAALNAWFESNKGSLFGLYDLFVGGSLERATIFALGIMPNVSASIILQLLTAVVPYFERLQKEGEEGRKKITQYTRYGTVVLAFIQGYGIAVFLEGLGAIPSGGVALNVVMNPGLGFTLMTMITLTAGTVFVMWLGEQITERGIGNGISLIITAGIIAEYPGNAINTVRQLMNGTLQPYMLVPLLGFMILVIAGVIAITQGQRRIPVQYAKRIVGRRVYGGQSTHIPLRVNTAGVIPIIFAQSLIMLPSTIIALFLPHNTPLAESLNSLLSPSSALYNILYVAIIIFFSYFYTAIIFNPVDLADNMKKYGGFVPGIRPGKKTAEYIDRILTRITLPGGMFLAAIAILPVFLIELANVPFYFGGTGLLITVGVTLDTLQQIESHLVMRHYDGFMKKGRLRGRR